MATATSQIITGTDFMSVPIRDLDTAVRFYGETLGLPRSVYMPERNYSEFETGNLTLSLVDARAMGIADEHTPLPLPISLHVEDVAAARKTLEERGVAFHGDTIDTGVCHMALFGDPDGNALMLHHRYAPRHTDA
jgi:predicted enzyme related to lactoylglutathione lyase